MHRVNAEAVLPMPRIALTIAGSDPSGGAGIQADLKTFHQHQVYGMAVLSLLTVQSTQGVTAVETMKPELVDAQLQHLLADIVPHAAKTGALGNAAIVEVVAARLKGSLFPLVVDPVMISKHGHALIDASARAALISRLLPVTFLVTPNTHEAEVLSGVPVKTLIEAREAAKRIAALGPQAVLIKGGHLEGAPVDVLFHRGSFTEFKAERVQTKNTHGTGCTLSAAITARLAMGQPVDVAIDLAKQWLTRALETAPDIGHGIGPVNHLLPI